jgi:hypothetical protein
MAHKYLKPQAIPAIPTQLTFIWTFVLLSSVHYHMKNKYLVRVRIEKRRSVNKVFNIYTGVDT